MFWEPEKMQEVTGREEKHDEEAEKAINDEERKKRVDNRVLFFMRRRQ